ncbi:MAG: transposase [Rhodocyclaceae bacterium]|nr:MAG: transposase [Rhodocyclaceae bacterium]
MKKNNIKLPQFANEENLNEFLLKSMGENLQQAIRSTVSLLIKTEMEQVRKQLFEEQQIMLQFNGSYPRNLISPAGQIPNIPIQRFRNGRMELDPLQSMQIFEAEKERFLKIVGELHLEGISQRKINRLCKNIFGKAVCPKTTKEVFENLLEEEAFGVNKQSLVELEIEYLFIDGLWETVKSLLTGQSRKKVVLVAVGLDKNQEKHVLGFELAFEEDEKSWVDFLEKLMKRGLDFSKVKLISLDGGTGCLSAIERLGIQTPLQSCLAHRYRNVLRKTGHQFKKEIGRDLKELTKSESREDFLKKVKTLEQKWSGVAPKAIDSLTRNLQLSLTYFDFPKELWVKIRTTNIIERIFREVRSRTRVHFDHYQSDKSASNYHQAIFGNLNRHFAQSISPSK